MNKADVCVAWASSFGASLQPVPLTRPNSLVYYD